VIREVRVAEEVYVQAQDRFSGTRSPDGAPSASDFVAGPLAAATFAFRDFDNLSYDLVPAIRSYTIVDPFFGPVVFVGIVVMDAFVEIVDFADDPDYWNVIEDDPH
jgi:hypothetical protein